LVCQEFVLERYSETEKGETQFFGIFHFRIIEGIMRFETLASYQTAKTLRKQRNGSLHGITIWIWMPWRGFLIMNFRVKMEIFFMDSKDKPCARQRTWRYRWHGQEVVEGETREGSDEGYLSTVIFSNKGTEVSGTFNCGYVKECHLTGVKTRPFPLQMHEGGPEHREQR
jgi:hypothetical protein